MQPPPSAEPRGYGELPDSAKEALERSSAEFTAGRLAERAQHARRAAARAAAPSPASGQAMADGPVPASGTAAVTGPGPVGGPAPVGGPVPASEQAGTPAGSPEPWFANVAEDAGPAGEQAGTPAGDGVPVAGNGATPDDRAMAIAQPAVQWAWLPIAAMVVPLALLLLVVLV